ncbi:Venom dipeptidyl peptidase 4 [Portunus trituberculatus]|uniref:Venom dipeptidyl peptidase 4 n=1 Tax=Portunus trituberculatus TaxID=210409 RepID=A0A5B7GEQ4_PORTR|nr:Venom dipeptidyl peptidase 4 [Portunus trituberculatus]
MSRELSISNYEPLLCLELLVTTSQHTLPLSSPSHNSLASFPLLLIPPRLFLPIHTHLFLLADSVYTERYMGSPRVYPGSNYKGYEAADATKVVGNLKGKMFLLVHGTADDNVHYHHSMMLAKALVDEDVLFQQMHPPSTLEFLEVGMGGQSTLCALYGLGIFTMSTSGTLGLAQGMQYTRQTLAEDTLYTYADENHGLTNVKEHLYRTLDKFLADCFRPTIPELYFLIKKKKKDVEEIGYLRLLRVAGCVLGELCVSWCVVVRKGTKQTRDVFPPVWGQLVKEVPMLCPVNSRRDAVYGNTTQVEYNVDSLQSGFWSTAV